MTSSTISPALSPGGQRPAVAAPTANAECVDAAFDGLTWTHLPGAAALLAAVPARSWSDPQAQGWQCVKRHARRDVWRAVIQGVPYYLKYYFRDSWLRRLSQRFREPACCAEWAGGLYARRAGIAAAQPVAHCLDVQRRGRRCALLVSEAIEPAQALNEFWLQLHSDDDGARRRRDTAQLCERLAELIARAHQAGFEHLDMHAANILVQPLGPRRYRAVFVDLQNARRGVPVSDRAVVRNLAQLNQWFRKHSSVGDRLRFLRAYLRWRNEFEVLLEHGRPLARSLPRLVQDLERAAHRHAWRLGAQRDRRISRNGRYFARLRLSDGWRGMAVASCKHATDESRASHLEFDRPWWLAQLDPPLRWFAGALAQACKNSHSATVGRAVLKHERDSVAVIIKRPRARNWQRWLAQLAPPSRSLRGWRMGHALLHRDVPTARPLAVLERRLGPLVLDSVLITEAVPGAIDLESYLREEYSAQTPAQWVRLKRQLGEALALELRRLHDRSFIHRDCKASNVLVARAPCLKLFWIDMDGLRVAGRFSKRDETRALARLNVSLLEVPGLTRTDRVRFLKAYFRRYGSPPNAWRAVWSALSHASKEKLRAKEARRAWKRKHYGRE